MSKPSGWAIMAQQMAKKIVAEQTRVRLMIGFDAAVIAGLKDSAGKDTLVTDKGEIIRCWIGLDGPIPELTVPVNGRQPHWATCPFADEFRKRG